MKRISLYFILILSLFASCDSFLEYKDKDMVIPNKLSHYEELIFGEILMKSSNAALCNLELMTDDAMSFVKDNLSSWSVDDRATDYGWYTWAIEPQLDKNGGERQDETWSFFYHKILMCNIVEHDLGAFENDIEGVKNRLLGEVQTMRALSYFYLVNMYGAPYESATQAATAMGVPINKEIGIYDHIYKRASLQVVYNLMEQDLLQAKQNFKNGENKNSKFRPNANLVNLLLTRIYLFQKQYDKVIQVATEAIEHSGLSVEPLSSFGSDYLLYYKGNSGILFTWGNGDQGPIVGSYYKEGRYAVSNDLMKLYEKSDKRASCFFDAYSGYYTKAKGTDMYRRCLRLEEIILNRAEAYIALGKEWSKGIDDVNTIRENRIIEDWKTTAKSKEDAERIYREERRRELCFEDTRWFDIRRWGVEVTHRYENFGDKSIYQLFKLPKNSPNYVLPIPLDEQLINTEIEQVKRVDCELKNN